MIGTQKCTNTHTYTHTHTHTHTYVLLLLQLAANSINWQWPLNKATRLSMQFVHKQLWAQAWTVDYTYTVVEIAFDLCLDKWLTQYYVYW